MKWTAGKLHMLRALGFLMVLQTADPASCAVIPEGIIWTTAGHLGTNGIRWTGADGTGDTLLANVGYPFDIALHRGQGTIYWADGLGSIGRVGTDGSGAQSLIDGLTKPWGIAVDESAQALYWADTDEGVIRRSTLDGGSVQVVLTGLSGPREIEIDPLEGKLYWVENGLGQIRRSNLDGSQIQVVVTGLPSGNYGVSGFDLDLVNRQVYWAEDGSNKVRRASMSPSGLVQTVVQGSQPVSVAVDPKHGHLYWTEYTPGRIYRANLDGGEKVILLNAYRPLGILYIPEPASLAVLVTGGFCVLNRRP